MSAEPVTLDLDRRSFMKASALAGATILGSGATGHVLSESGGEGEPEGVREDAETSKVICNYCSVGCGFKAVKDGDSFVGMEPWKENPINNGSLCSKGAGILETEHSENRLKHPLKRENGEWRKVSWDEAYDMIAEEWKRITKEYGPDSTMLVGSAHFSNGESYAYRKLAAFMGTNNVDHQARICHSPTVAGLANTWGFGAMTNTVNDYRNFDLNIIIGQNPAESHPIAMQHILEGQARGGKIVSIDPRFTKTSAHADDYFRMRPGTDVALIMGLINYLDEQDELDEEMLDGRVNGWEDVYAELDQYDLETVADITWLDKKDIQQIGDMIIENKPNVQIEWAMGGTQHNNGTQNIRSYALLSLASGSAARSGGGLQVMRGHANVQGATDMGVDADILPGYYSVSSPGSWAHWANVWNKSPWTSGSTDFDDLYNRFDVMPEDIWKKTGKDEKKVTTDQIDVLDSHEDEEDSTHRPGEVSTRSMMFQSGLTVARWYEAALQQKDRLHESDLYQPNPLKMLFFWGHSANSINEMEKMKKAMETLDLMVVVDVFPAVAGTLAESDDNILLLPASSQYEHYRSLTNTHRSVQWSEPAGKPAHNSKPDLQIMQEIADRLGFGEHFDWGTGQELYNGKSTYEDAIREINLGARSIGYQQSPEKLQQHVEYDWAFSTETLRAESEGLPVSGEYWSLPWPYWGKGHTGTPIIWRDDMDPRKGGHDFRANWGVKAPTPEEWETDWSVDREYPLQETYDKHGEDGLNMLRDTYEPEWWNSEIEGVPQYPHYATMLPEDVSNPSEMALPVKYALSEEHSPYDAAKELVENYGHDLDLEFWKEYDVAQPDPPTGRGRARGVAWNFLDTVPVHREPIESPRPDLAEEWPANGQQNNFYRLDQNNGKTQQTATERAAKNGFDVILTSGRQVEHQGGGAETRNNPLTADRQPYMYAEIHPDRAEKMGITGGEDDVIIHPSDSEKSSILVKAKVDYRPHPDEVFLPYHWGGVFAGKDNTDNYPEGTKPLAIGDSVNIVTARGFDAETQMQETKAAMVRVEKATPERIKKYGMEFIDFPQEEEGLGLQKQYDVREHNMLADD